MPSIKTAEAQRNYLGKLGGWLSIFVNIILFISKLIFGLFIGSVALIADAFHTLSDLSTSFLVVFTFKVTAKPSDAQHPFGHGRAELISTLIIATIFGITAFELLKYGIDRMLSPTEFIAPISVIVFVIITVIIKEILALYTMYLSRKINSITLKADAVHHHQDAISSFLVVIAFGLSRFNFYYLDAPVGILIGLIILYSAYKIARSPIDHLLGNAPEDKLLSQIEKTCLCDDNIQGVHDIIVHQYGESKIISLHIEVDENMSLDKAHSISENVDKRLRKILNAYVTVHVDPVMRRTALYRAVEQVLLNFCDDSTECSSFHDLRILGENNKLRLVLDLVVNPEVKIFEDKLIKNCKTYLFDNIPEISDVSIKIEPIFSVSRRSRHN